MAKISIKEIARHSGVSIATVSRTLRSPDIVAEKTRKRVMAAVKEFDYRPNRMGANLRTQRSGNIVAIIPDITGSFNAGIIRSLESAAGNLGYSVLLGDTQGEDSRARHFADMVSSGQADGILLFSHKLPFDFDVTTSSTKQLPPIVNASESVAGMDLTKVLIDNVAAAKLAVKHLLDLGHTRIAAIAGTQNTPTSRNRLTGFKQALSEAGLELDEQLVYPGDYDVQSGINATEKLLQLKERPTAIFAFSDEMALGAMRVLTSNGYSVPGDISIIGFDDIKYSSVITPTLTTIRQPIEEIGRLAMIQLDAAIQGEPTQSYTNLPVELIVRESTGPVPH